MFAKHNSCRGVVIWGLVAAFTGAAACGGQAVPKASGTKPAVAPAAAATMLVDITLERKTGSKVEQMAAGHVFQPGDIVRLRLRSHYTGFLYVLDQGSSGKFSTVFPSQEAGRENRLRAGEEYLVPALEGGWFEVEGPPGFDVLYFLLSPSALPSPAVSSFAAPGPASSLRPRCNDEIFKARGECTDDTAGPAAVPRGAVLPAPLAPMAQGAARDLVFVEEPTGSVGVSAAQKPEQNAVQSGAPVLYTFRLAHQ